MKSVRERQVTVYGTHWCPLSRQVKAWLDNHHVLYGEVDVEHDAAAARQVESWNDGYRSVPTITARLIVTEPPDADLERILLKSRAHLMACTVYMTSWCPDCRRTLAWLKAQGIPFVAVDIDSDVQAAKRVQAWNRGFRSVPTLDLSLRLTEPSMEQVEAMLGLGE
jgi:mycoredoxin